MVQCFFIIESITLRWCYRCMSCTFAWGDCWPGIGHMVLLLFAEWYAVSLISKDLKTNWSVWIFDTSSLVLASFPFFQACGLCAIALASKCKLVYKQTFVSDMPPFQHVQTICRWLAKFSEQENLSLALLLKVLIKSNQIIYIRHQSDRYSHSIQEKFSAATRREAWKIWFDLRGHRTQQSPNGQAQELLEEIESKKWKTLNEWRM